MKKSSVSEILVFRDTHTEVTLVWTQEHLSSSTVRRHIRGFIISIGKRLKKSSVSEFMNVSRPQLLTRGITESEQRTNTNPSKRVYVI